LVFFQRNFLGVTSKADLGKPVILQIVVIWSWGLANYAKNLH